MRISILFLFLFNGLFCFAQIEFSDSLSAKDAVLIALKNNYDIQVSNAQLDISEKNNSWSEAGLFPTVALNVGYNNTIQDNSNNPFTFTPGVILSRSLSPNLSLNLNLFSGFAVKISKERLEKLEEQSKGNALLVVESTILDVLKAYYSARVQYDRLMILNQLKTDAHNRYQFYVSKNKYANSSSLEELQFKNQYFSDSTNALVQEYSLKNALRNLFLLMNNSEIEEDIKIPFLTDGLEFDFPIMDFNEVMNSLKGNNQQLKNQLIGIEIQQLNTSFQKSFLYPTLSLQGSFTPSKSWFEDLNGTFDPVQTEIINYNGTINLRYTIFNNWKNKRAVEVSKIQESISQMNYNKMEKTMRSSMATLIDSYKGNSNLVELSTANIEFATKTFELAKKRLERGTLNSIDLLVFENSYQNQMLQHYEFLFNKINTFLEIYKLSGKLALDYVND